MIKNKFFILDSCSHNTSDMLISILQSNFDCENQLVKPNQIQEFNNSSKPDIYFWIKDEKDNENFTLVNTFKSIPSIGVICTKDSKAKRDWSLISGIDDFIFTPLRKTEIIYRVMRFIGSVNSEEREVAKKNILQKVGISRLIGQDPVFLDRISKIPKVADCDVTILLAGETGVGKEVCARAIHYLSKRSDKPFIPVNCGAIPTNLIENELFGHKKGVFTDAQSNQYGLIAEASGGTLFLDEIDSLSLDSQSKILRLLQDKIYRPLGQSKDIKANIRVIGATNADLKQQIKKNLFREDLFYRFTITLKLPALRERASDIPLLANSFLKKYLKEFDREHKSLSPSALQKLMIYHWPGNIRELENIIQQAILLNPGSVITPHNIHIQDPSTNITNDELSFSKAKRMALEQFEKDYLTRLLISYNGNVSRAANKAQKDRGDFSKLMKKFNLNRKAFLKHQS